MKTDYIAGMTTILTGIGIIFWSYKYDIGTLRQMGPGYYPMLLGYLMTIFGIIIIIQIRYKANRSGKYTPQKRSSIKSYLRPWLSIIAGMFAFLALGYYTGFLLGTLLLITLSALGDRETSIIQAIFLGIIVTAATIGIFVYGLGMQFPLIKY